MPPALRRENFESGCSLCMGENCEELSFGTGESILRKSFMGLSIIMLNGIKRNIKKFLFLN
jgi:hypothetical protein